MLVLTILVNGEPSGMIDLHKLVPNKKAEIGYWLASKYQGRGIVTKSVTALCQYAFSELNLQYIDLLVAVGNDKSSNVAKRCGFKLMGIEPKLINGYDGQIFRLFGILILYYQNKLKYNYVIRCLASMSGRLMVNLILMQDIRA